LEVRVDKATDDTSVDQVLSHKYMKSSSD